MNTLIHSLLIFLILVFVTACGGGETPANTDIPTDTSLAFSAFPPGYFDGSYSATFSYTGTDTDGDTYTATFSATSGADTTHNSLPVKTINEAMLMTNTVTNVVGSSLTNTYFSTDINNLQYLGYYTASPVVTAIATSTSVIPITTTIGKSGIIGNYVRDDTSTFTKDWALFDGFNGKAKLIVTTTSNDTSGNLYAITKITNLISQDGTKLNEEVIITYYHQNGSVIRILTLNSI